MPETPSGAMPLVPAPGARGAKLCGIWSILVSATCIGIPIGLVLAIVALVQQAKANRLAKENPDLYERPAATGLVTGIIGLVMPLVMLPFIGIVSAIAIPALLSQRARARDKVAQMNLVGRTGDLVGQFDRQREQNTPMEQIPSALEAWLQENTGTDKNPWNIQAPAYSYHIEVVSGLDEEGVGQMAASEATSLGQPVWVIELPLQGQPGYLSGAVRLQNSSQSNPRVKTVALD